MKNVRKIALCLFKGIRLENGGKFRENKRKPPRASSGLMKTKVFLLLRKLRPTLHRAGRDAEGTEEEIVTGSQ